MHDEDPFDDESSSVMYTTSPRIGGGEDVPGGGGRRFLLKPYYLFTFFSLRMPFRALYVCTRTFADGIVHHDPSPGIATGSGTRSYISACIVRGVHNVTMHCK